MNYLDIAVIVLAAGKGTRMKSIDKNKVTSQVGDKPLILRTYENLINQGLKNIFVVVGFAKESVMDNLGQGVEYVTQAKQLGTGHAAATALLQIPKAVNTILVMGGDDSAFYTDNILVDFLNFHLKRHAKMSLMTVNRENPSGLGRIVRKSINSHHIQEIVEEKNASDAQRQIKEINTGCYLFDRKFLEENIKKIGKNPVTQEYYLTDILKIAVDQNIPVHAFLISEKYFWGVNTPAELEEANRKVRLDISV